MIYKHKADDEIGEVPRGGAEKGAMAFEGLRR